MRCVAFGNHTRKNIIPERVAYSIGYDMQRGESDGPPSRRCPFLYRILLRELPSSWPTRPTRSATTFMITAIIKNAIFRRQVGRWRIAVLERQANHDVERAFRHAPAVVAVTIRQGAWLLGVKAPVSIECTDDALTVRSTARHQRHAALKAQAVHWRATSARRPTPRVRIRCADGALAGRRLAICYSQIANGRPPPRGTTYPAGDSHAGHASARSA